MKIGFSENDYGIDLSLTPENVEELGQLLRYVNNAKKEKPDVWFNFSSKEPYLYLNLKKVAKSVQTNSISK